MKSSACYRRRKEPDLAFLFYLKPFAIIRIVLNLQSEDCESSSGVEHNLAKVGVAGSNPVFRSKIVQKTTGLPKQLMKAEVVELVDTLDLKSNGQ